MILGVYQQQYEDWSTHVWSHVSKVSLKLSKNSFATPSTKQNGHTTGLKIFKMKDTDFNKLLAATTTGTSEMEAFFSNEFIE